MPSRRKARREKNHAEMISKLNENCVDESLDVCEKCDSFQEAHEKKNKACDRKCYKADSESKESAKAQYWLDQESKKDSVKAYYDQNREPILASKEAQYQANPKAKRDISRINRQEKKSY